MSLIMIYFDFCLLIFKGAMLIVRWILNEEDIDEQVTISELDNIAQMVQESLCANDSSIRIAVPSAMEERISRTDAANPVVTHPEACLRLLNCLKHVLYEQLHFKGNVDEYYKKENSLLHEVSQLVSCIAKKDSQ